MADLADLADDFIYDNLAFKVREIRNNIKHHMGAKDCIYCETEIPLGRRKLGYDLCIHCAELEERRGYLYANDRQSAYMDC